MVRASTPPYEVGEAVSAMHDCVLGRGRVREITCRPDGGWNVSVIILAWPTPKAMEYTVTARGHSDYMDHGANSPQMFTPDRPTVPELGELLALMNAQAQA